MATPCKLFVDGEMMTIPEVFDHALKSKPPAVPDPSKKNVPWALQLTIDLTTLEDTAKPGQIDAKLLEALDKMLDANPGVVVARSTG